MHAEFFFVWLWICHWFLIVFRITSRHHRGYILAYPVYLLLQWIPITLVAWSLDVLVRTLKSEHIHGKVWIVCELLFIVSCCSTHFAVTTRLRRPQSIPMMLIDSKTQRKLVTDTTVVLFSDASETMSWYISVVSGMISLYHAYAFLVVRSPLTILTMEFGHILEAISGLNRLTLTSFHDTLATVLAPYSIILVALAAYVFAISSSFARDSTSDAEQPSALYLPSCELRDIMHVSLALFNLNQSQRGAIDSQLAPRDSSLILLYALLLDGYLSTVGKPASTERARNDEVAGLLERIMACNSVWIMPSYHTAIPVEPESVHSSQQHHPVSSSAESVSSFHAWLRLLDLFTMPSFLHTPPQGSFYLHVRTCPKVMKPLQGSRLPSLATLMEARYFDAAIPTDAANSTEVNCVSTMGSSTPNAHTRQRGIFGMDHVLLNLASQDALYVSSLSRPISQQDVRCYTGSTTTWGNLGCWTVEPYNDYPQACERLLLELLVASQLLSPVSSKLPTLSLREALGLTNARWQDMVTSEQSLQPSVAPQQRQRISILDVACGSGDQLLATLAHLVLESNTSELGSTVSSTLRPAIHLTGVNLVGCQVQAARSLVSSRRFLAQQVLSSQNHIDAVATGSVYQSNSQERLTNSNSRILQDFLSVTNESNLRIIQGDATQLHLCSLNVDEPFTHVLCLDSAYHFNTRAVFFQSAATRLESGGHLAVTDLVLHPSLRESLVALPLLRSIATLASIPSINLKFEDEYRHELENIGFQNVQFKYLDNYVLLGFARFVEEVLGSGSTSSSQPNSLWRLADWLSPAALRKFRITAKLLKYVGIHGMLRYAVISARKI